MSEIRLALAGVGNAASAFVQSLTFYSSPAGKRKQEFLVYDKIGGYSLSDIRIVAAFDITEKKVSSPLLKAMFTKPNVVKHYVDEASLAEFSIEVQRGPTADGINPVAKDVIEESKKPPVDILKALKTSKAEILLCLLPSGAEKAVHQYAEAALGANCAFINATPTVVASAREWGQRFKKAGLPVVGDDLQSQLGGTRIHKGVLEILKNFGAEIINTYNLDVSGGSEALVALDSGYRTQIMKSKIKSESIRRVVPYLSSNDVATGTTDYLDFLGNQRIGHFWIKVLDFLAGEIHIDITVKSDDGPNAAGTLVDVVRSTKVALDRSLDGPQFAISAYGFKNPPLYLTELAAHKAFQEFVTGERVI